jgi:8-oxo-dGTP diphosphatase
MTGIDVLLIRHAHAGKRGIADDDHRPLSDKGRRQAEGIAQRYRDLAIVRTLTSPYTRCVETIEPLAATLGTEVEVVDELGEGYGPVPALTLVETATAPIALCSHGDVIGEVLMLLDRRGVELPTDGLAKGSTWRLRVVDGAVVTARYDAPPR